MHRYQHLFWGLDLMVFETDHTGGLHVSQGHDIEVSDMFSNR